MYSVKHLRSKSELLNCFPSSVDLNNQGSFDLLLDHYSFSNIEPKEFIEKVRIESKKEVQNKV